VKVVHFVYADKNGECEGLFDADFNLIYFWSCNDATWRSEYFAGVLEYLGATEGDPSDAEYDTMVGKLNDATKEAWRCYEAEEE
jgi:hypothetical protein